MVVSLLLFDLDLTSLRIYFQIIIDVFIFLNLLLWDLIRNILFLVIIIAYVTHVALFLIFLPLVVPLVALDDPPSECALDLLHDCHN